MASSKTIWKCFTFGGPSNGYIYFSTRPLPSSNGFSFDVLMENFTDTIPMPLSLSASRNCPILSPVWIRRWAYRNPISSLWSVLIYPLPVEIKFIVWIFCMPLLSMFLVTSRKPKNSKRYVLRIVHSL